MNSVEVERRLPSALLATAMLVVVAILSGCGLFGDPDSTDSEDGCDPNGELAWCYTDGVAEEEDSYDRSISRLYCHVTQVRERVVDDEISLEDLPAWADRDYRNGAPIVIDLSTVPAPEFDRRIDDLFIHFREIGEPLDSDKINTCNDELTQRDIESTDGKRRAG